MKISAGSSTTSQALTSFGWNEEESGSDNMKIENLRERLSAQEKRKNFYCGYFAAARLLKANFNNPSVDFFTAAVNRKTP